MYAVIRTGGKQYKVATDDVLAVEKLTAEAGSSIAFDEVLMLGEGEDVTVGAPLVAGASVKADIVEQTRGDKIIVFKKKRRKNYRRRQGHRQDLTVVRITDILDADGKSTAATAKPTADAKPKGDAKPKAAAKPKVAAKREAKAKPAAKAKGADKKTAAKSSKKPAAKAAKTKAKAKKPAAKE
jgi:large subunit ribosomal protein L21